MFKLIGKGTILVSMLCLLGSAAVAKTPSPAVAEIQLDRLANIGPIDARILDVNYSDRTLTVRRDDNNKTSKLIVPENADIMLTLPNNLEHRIDLVELRSGEEIRLEAVAVKGVLTLHIIGLESS